MAVNRDIKYINKDFNEFRSQLLNFAQTYFPSTYTDFTPSSPGVMFMEMASYIGDVLSFYLDNQIQENFLQYARQSNNLYELAYMFNYKPKTTGLATVNIDFFQLVPSKTIGSDVAPDYDYALYIDSNTQISSRSSNNKFIIEDSIDFTISSSLDPTTVSVAQVAGGSPTYYLLKKTRKATSGIINTVNFSFGPPVEFATVNINGANIAGVIDIIDSDGNTWYEVDHLAQELVFDGIKNTNINDPNNYQNSNDTPYILQTKQVQRRFTTRFINPTTLQLQFGSGSPNDNDENIIPNPSNVGLGLPFEKNKLTTAYSPTNFIFTNTYGISPSNTTLTIRYLTGGGVTSNVNANDLVILSTSNIRFLKNNLNSTTSQYIFNSVASNNENAASGGRGGDSIEEIRQNTISNFSTQLRNVTADDYLVRALSMSPRYGIVAKAYTEKPKADDINTTLDLYILSYNSAGNLTIASNTLKNNLKTYINQYRMIGDTISIKDAFIINIACDFEIITLPNYNGNEVIFRCISALQEYFNINKWQINQPIILKDINTLIDNIEGVQTVNKVNITNKAGTTSGYSQYAYDIAGATQKGIIYPSLDPSIFELKFPNTDIKGRVVTI
jgi:uncharacterized protein YrzB (UPF0473 family)